MAQLQTPAGSHSRQEPAIGGFAVEAPGGAVIKSRRAGEPESRRAGEPESRRAGEPESRRAGEPESLAMSAGARHAPGEPHTVSAAA